MKKIIILILIAVFGLILLSISVFYEKDYEVIDILEGDLIYIDLNKNKVSDENELFHLEGINTFPLKFNNKTKIYMEKFGLSEKEVFGLGNLGFEFTKNNLLNKRVKFIEKPKEYNPDYRYRFGKISLDNVDYAKVLLTSGLASAYWGEEGLPYLEFENKEKIKENIKKLNIKVEDKKTKEQEKEKIKVKDNYKIKGLAIYFLDPNKFNKPNYKCSTDACKILLSSINKAQENIDLAIYGIENQNEILNALTSAKNRGVKIRCVVDANPKNEYMYNDTHKLKSICELKSDNTRYFMHNKFFIFDNEKVITGSTNITPTGLGGYNSNSFLVIENNEIAEIYKKEFEQMFKGSFQDKKVNMSLKNIKINENTKADIYFSPNVKIYENVFHPLITNSKKSIYIDVFYLTHKGISDDLIEAHKRGVEVKIIIDATSAHNPKTKLKELKDSGVKVKVENWGGKAHEKTMSIDDSCLILGSANFTNSGINHNDENILVIYNSDISKFYNKFFMHLYNSIDDKYLYKIPSAESFSSKNSCTDGIDNDFDGKIDLEDEGCKSSN